MEGSEFGGSSRSTGDGSNLAGELMRAMQMLINQQAANTTGQGATKALRDVIGKVGRFDGKNVTKFLRVYTCEMEIYQVPENRIIETFDLAVVPEIRERVRQLHGDIHVNTWARFEERLRDEYFDEDSERMTKRAFFEWVEQRPGKHMGASELLREFEKKFGQLPLSERRLLEARKSEMFLQASDEALEDRLLLLLQDGGAEGGFTTDWGRMTESVNLVAKQQRVKSRGTNSRIDVTGVSTPKASVSPDTSMVPSTTGNTSKGKVVDDNTLEELMRGIRELKVEMSALKRDSKPRTSQPSIGQKEFVVRCIWCDDPNHKRGDCGSYADAMKNGIITFKEGRIRDASTDEPLQTNFGKGGMKKLMDDRLGRSTSSRGKETETYSIEADLSTIETATPTAKEVMVRGAQAIRKLTGWDDPVNASTIRAYLMSEHGEKELHDASVEVKRGRAPDESESEEPVSKKKPSNAKETASKEGPSSNTRQRQEPKPYPGENTPLPKDKWEERMNKKDIGKEDEAKRKGKAPAYKLQSDIESSVDMKGILEERILDAKIEFTLREALGIAKKDFHELIIDVIKRKRQMTAETVMTKALDTLMSKDEEEEIGQVFALECDNTYSEDQRNGHDIISDETYDADVSVTEELLSDDLEDEVLQMFLYDGMSITKEKTNTNQNEEERIATEAKVLQCGADRSWKHDGEALVTFTHPFWARATTETRVKIGDIEEPILALVDHGSEINIVSRKIYEKGKWPIDTNHGWVLRVANNEKGNLYGACPAVTIKIGDVEVEQNFFVLNQGGYPIILGQPYITATRMETKVLDDGSHYARIRSYDGMRSVQFLTVKPNHERHRDRLREIPMDYAHEDFSDF